MEEPKKKKKHEELTSKRRTEKGSLEEKWTLEQKLNKEKIQKKGKRREKCKTSGQNMRRKTKTCPHDERILAVHVAFNYSNTKTVINAQYTEYEASNEIVLISSNRRQFEQGASWWVRNLWSSLDHHLPWEDVTHLLCSLMTKHNGWSNGHRMSCEFQTKIL